VLDLVPSTGPTTNQLVGPQATTFDATTFYATNVGNRLPGNLGFDK
jgi:hypothetical protein